MKLKELKQKEKTINLKGQEFKIAFNMNAFCDIEDKFGSIDKAMKLLQPKKDAVSFKAMRSMLTICINAAEEKELSERAVGKLLDMENFGQVTEVLGDLFSGGEDQEENEGN